MVSPEILPTLPPALDYFGVAVFALTGALAAARDRHDIITFWFFAVVTGIGGGTLRDLLMDAPVFWIGDPTYLGIGLAAAIAVWFAAPHLERAKTLIWLDAVGLGGYAVIGAGKAMSWRQPVRLDRDGRADGLLRRRNPRCARGSALGASEARDHDFGSVACGRELCRARRRRHAAADRRHHRRSPGFRFARWGHTLWLGVAGVWSKA
jgi:hypothetical protein